MTDPDHVEIEVLRPMQALFLPPRMQMDDGAQREALRGYHTALRGFSRTELRTAWTEVVATHATRSWPVPGVIVLAARKAQKDRSIGQTWTRAKDATVNHRARWNTWLDVRASQLGADAAAAGCSWSLRCAILNDGKAPGEINLAELTRSKASAQETADAIADGSPILYKGVWLKFEVANRGKPLEMFANLLRNESETADEVRRAHSSASAPRTEAA